MKISPDNPHLKKLLEGIYDECYFDNGGEFDARRATNLGITIEEYRELRLGFLSGTPTDRQKTIEAILKGELSRTELDTISSKSGRTSTKQVPTQHRRSVQRS